MHNKPTRTNTIHRTLIEEICFYVWLQIETFNRQQKKQLSFNVEHIQFWIGTKIIRALRFLFSVCKLPRALDEPMQYTNIIHLARETHANTTELTTDNRKLSSIQIACCCSSMCCICVL